MPRERFLCVRQWTLANCSLVGCSRSSQSTFAEAQTVMQAILKTSHGNYTQKLRMPPVIWTAGCVVATLGIERVCLSFHRILGPLSQHGDHLQHRPQHKDTICRNSFSRNIILSGPQHVTRCGQLWSPSSRCACELIGASPGVKCKMPAACKTAASGAILTWIYFLALARVSACCCNTL